jgi:hypothetical protein
MRPGYIVSWGLVEERKEESSFLKKTSQKLLAWAG